jgi:hypothetical protein
VEDDLTEEEGVDTGDKVKVADAVIAAKELGKGFCMHEVLANKASDSGVEPMCPPILVKDIKEGKLEVEVGNRGENVVSTDVEQSYEGRTRNASVSSISNDGEMKVKK